MKKLFLTAIVFLLSVTTCAASSVSATTAELDAAEIRLVCAICSTGAYSDDESYFLQSMLTSRGWTIEKIPRKKNPADAKAYLISRGDVKILAIAGADSLQDVEENFRVGRVNLNDNTALAADEKNSAEKLFVHRGFRDYADEVLSDGLAEWLKSSLEKNPREVIYLTGHSLNGSAATIMAIRLSDFGVGKNRLKVITFGAPAVGSHGLARAYEDRIDLTRVAMSGDGMKKSLRSLGYVHFGKTLEYKRSRTGDHEPHKMSVYLDSAIRDYFNAGGTLAKDTQEKIPAQIYVAPLMIVKGSFRKSDDEIILHALNDGLTNHFGNLTFADMEKVELRAKDVLDEDFDEFIADAKNRGCKYVLFRVLSAKKIRDAPKGTVLVTIEEIIFDANGSILNMKTSGTSTENFTILEAVLAAQENLLEDTKNFFTVQ